LGDIVETMPRFWIPWIEEAQEPPPSGIPYRNEAVELDDETRLLVELLCWVRAYASHRYEGRVNKSLSFPHYFENVFKTLGTKGRCSS
jgi:hypothetical protein